MAQLKISPVVHCRVCGQPLVVKLETIDDPEQTLLMAMLKTLEKRALCPYHQAQYDYYKRTGRQKEWEEGNL